MPRQRDIRAQRLARESERWQQERDDEDEAESRDVPDRDDDPPSRESMT